MTEYFISYYRTIYPTECKSLCNCDRPLIDVQRAKKCFSTHCDGCSRHGGTDDEKANLCNWDRCNYDPYSCDTDPCPKSKQELDCRGPIGALTEEELETFEELTEIKNMPQYVLYSDAEIDDASIAAKVKHDALVQKFYQYLRLAVSDPIFFPLSNEIEFLTTCRDTAGKIRLLRRQKPAVEAISINQDEPAPALHMAAAGNKNRSIIPLEAYGEESPIEWADETMDVSVKQLPEEYLQQTTKAVRDGTLQAHALLGDGIPEKERNRLLREAGLSPAEIARMNGTPEDMVRSEADRIAKQTNRANKGK